jgi:hypothetical protein
MAKLVDNLTAQVTRKQEEMRVKDGQVSLNNNTIDSLSAQASVICVFAITIEFCRCIR